MLRCRIPNQRVRGLALIEYHPNTWKRKSRLVFLKVIMAHSSKRSCSNKIGNSDFWMIGDAEVKAMASRRTWNYADGQTKK